MALIIYGTKETFIDLNEFFIKCPACESDSWADIMVMSVYYHAYYLPIFPFDKNANIICKKCGLRRYGIGFDKKLIKNLDEVKHKYKHPWFTYIGVSIALFLVTMFIIKAFSE